MPILGERVCRGLRGPPHASLTELDGSRDTLGHNLHGTAAPRALPTTYMTYRHKQRPTDAPAAPEHWASASTRNAPALSTRRRPRATRRGPASAARGVRMNRARDDGQPLRTARTRAAQRSTRSTVRAKHTGRAARHRDAADDRAAVRAARRWTHLEQHAKKPPGLTPGRPCTRS